jgi:hypothetical protein
LFHTQKFSDKWGMSFDAQFRSASHYDYLQNILLRPSVNYYFDKNKMAALGYAYIATNGRAAGGVETFRPESRIWEQLIINTKIGKTSTLQHRFRLEQRFLGNTTNRTDHYFSQRLRYFARAVVPFKKSETFTKGAFLGLQNEVLPMCRTTIRLINTSSTKTVLTLHWVIACTKRPILSLVT